MIPVYFYKRRRKTVIKRGAIKMKKRMCVHNIIVFMVAILCVGMLTVTSAATVKETEGGTKSSSIFVKKNTIKKKKNVGKIVIKNGNKFYKKNGKIVKRKFVKIKGKIYHFGKNGAMTTGWMKYKGNYYYFNRSNGRMAKKRKVDGITINREGKAKNTEDNVKKIKTMIRAKKRMLKLCESTDTKEQRLRKCFDWVAKAPYKRYRFLKPIYKTKGWEVTFANDILENGDGCCVSEAAALAFLVHECGYKTVYVAHDSEHAWMELNGKVYDTLFARSKDYEKYYNLSYSNYNCHAIDKRKI